MLKMLEGIVVISFSLLCYGSRLRTQLIPPLISNGE
jgi:hypothetical protein